MTLKRKTKLLHALETLKITLTSSNKTRDELMTSIRNLIVELNYIIYDHYNSGNECSEQNWLKDNK